MNTSIPSHFISADQSYMYRMQSPFFLAIDERIVAPDLPSRELHWHDFFEIEIVLSGSGVHQYNGTNYPLTTGCAYLQTPMDIHALIPNPGEDLHLIHLRFDEQAIFGEVRDLLLQQNRGHSTKLSERDFSRLLDQIHELLQCFEVNNTQSLSIQLMLSYLCLHIIRESKEKDSPFSTYTSTNPVVHQTLQYIFYNFRKKITMQELGDKAHVSPNHLALLFKQATGVTCMQMISDLRLQYALRLLENPNLNVETISAQSGFSAASYFISVFRKKYGITPKEYQNINAVQRNEQDGLTEISEDYSMDHHGN